MKIAKRGRIPPFYAMEVLRDASARAARGADIIHLEVGQPAAGAAQPVIAAAHLALDGARIGYTDALGLGALRARIAVHYGERYGLDVAPERVVVTTGSSGGFLLTFLAAFDAGDRVAVAEPGYPAYRNILSALGLTPVPIVTRAAANFQPTLADLEAAGPIDGLIVASPANPTGAMLSAAALDAIARWCESREVRLISDEIYHGITYEAEATSALASSARAVIVNSFSKYYAMTGWRLGWLVVPTDLIETIERLAQSLFISPPSLAQQVAVHAFDCTAELDALVAGYAANRALLLAALPKIGFGDFVAPAGAFYVYPRLPDGESDASAFCARALAEANVALTPGIDFDPGRGRHYVRISFAGAEADIATAIARLTAWLRRD